MDNASTPESPDQATESAEPEVLKPRADDSAPTADAAAASADSTTMADKKTRHRTYRPSHKATFIGLTVVVLILAINAGILGFVLVGKSKNKQLASGQVTISPAVLSKLGVNSSSTGSSGVVLVVGPDAQFNGKVTIASDVSIGGQLKLNSTLNASNATFTQLQAGKTSLSQLDVNGNTTLTNLSIRSGLAVTGATQLQGPVTASQLLTVNNSLNVSGNLAVGGVLSTKSFSAVSLVASSTLTVGGHIITGGLTPGVGPGSGSALGSNGTVSISGNDSAGRITANIGSGGGGNGIMANVAFRNQYGSVPRVILTPIGFACNIYVTNQTVAGFSVGGGCALSAGASLGINYIVEQ